MKHARVLLALTALIALLFSASVMADELNVFELSVVEGQIVSGEYIVDFNDTLSIDVIKSGEWESATVAWLSSDISVAYVNEGVVFPQSPGGCTITATGTVEATGASISASIKVRIIGVQPEPTVVTIWGSGGATSVVKGETLQMMANVTPAGVGIEWSSSRPAVISVDDDGLLLGLKKGKSIITASAMDASGASDSMAIEVVVVPTSVTVTPTKKELYVGGTTSKLKSIGALKAVVKPYSANTKVTWKSSEPSIVRVGQKGKVYAQKRGKATITATTVNGLKDKCVVTVYKLPTIVWLPAMKKVYVNKKLNLGSLLKIDGDIKTVVWRSSNKKIAKVNGKGVVTGVKPGQCRIGVKAVNGKSDVCIVNVYASKGVNDPPLIDEEWINDGMPTPAQLAD